MDDEKKYKCTQKGCDKKFKTKSGLGLHLVDKHQINCKWYYCSKCSYKTTRNSSLKNHIKNKHSNIIKKTQYACSICKKKFTSKDDRNKHQITHSNNEIIYYKCDYKGCNKQYTYKTSLKKHISLKHKEIETWYHCNLCSSKFPLKESLKQHIFTVHSNNFIKCDLCDKKVKTNGALALHKKFIHNISVIWNKCNLCDKKFKSKGGLKNHKKNIHHIDLEWIKCTICNYKCKSKSNLNTHIQLNHIIKENKFKCNICNKFYKTEYNLKSHIQGIHNFNGNKIECYICHAKLKTKQSLKQHLANKHDIGVKYFYCDQEGCDHKCKNNSDLKKHLENMHDIGKHPCDFCLGNRNSSIQYKDKAGTHKICRACYNKATGKNSRVEHTWSDYLDKKVGTNYLLSSDKSLKSMGGCSLKRPDKLYTSPDLIILGECDEKQHLYNNGSYECEDRRISEIYDEPTFSGKKMVVIRWNPDNYTPPEGYEKHKRDVRLKTCSNLIQHLMKTPPSDLITIYYLFYNEDNPRISRAYPVEMIYDETDFLTLI